MNNIVWKPVLGFNGYYEVSNTGIVRSIDRYVDGKNGSLRFVPGVILKQQTNHKGYQKVILHKFGKFFSKSVHRLVAEVFIENPYDLPQVNHKDTNKKNNNVDNLEWITNDDNQRHAIANGCYKEFTDKQYDSVMKNLIHANERRRVPVVQCDLDGNEINEYESVIAAAKSNNLADSHISQCCNGTRNSCGGYRWKRKL